VLTELLSFSFLNLQSKDDDSSLKIADFGFSKKCPEAGLTSMCGTPGYVAPELLEKIPYDWQCDMWSLGVVVFILLGGYAPFEEKDQKTLFHKIVKADYEFHDEYWSSISDDAKDLIRSLLTLDPRKRLTASQALEHKWITASDHILAEQDLGVNLTELKKFNAKRKWRAAVKTVVFSHKLKSLFSLKEEE
jgi:calcium/calmodulin-dependent protein kinase I